MRRWPYSYVKGVEEGVDFDARYQIGPYAVAWTLLGWQHVWDEELEDWMPDLGGRIAARMVGDDHIEFVNAEDLRKIEDDEYCSTCGQLGCAWG